MGPIALVLEYFPPDGANPIPVCTSADQGLIAEFRRHVLTVALARVHAAPDPVGARIEEAERSRLRALLAFLLDGEEAPL